MRYQQLTKRTRLLIVVILLVLFVLMVTFDVGSGFFTGLVGGLLISTAFAEVILYFKKSTP